MILALLVCLMELPPVEPLQPKFKFERMTVEDSGLPEIRGLGQ